MNLTIDDKIQLHIGAYKDAETDRERTVVKRLYEHLIRTNITYHEQREYIRYFDEMVGRQIK